MKSYTNLWKNEYCKLALAIAIYVMVVSFFIFWKYLTNKYNALDLAIYNQVFWNLAHGHGAYSSIQGSNYFGDHAEFFIFLLLPFYFLLPHPLTLLFLQTLGLASTAIPLYLLTKIILKPQIQSRQLSYLSLLVALLWLLNPIVWNINFFEFHILPFAIPLILWTVYFYFTDRRWLFLIFMFLSLLVREDAALVIFALGILIISRKKWLGLTTLSASALWFFVATRITNILSPNAHYKYLLYYAWLGSTSKEIIYSALTNPLKIIHHVTTVPNLEMVIGFLMSFIFLPLFAPQFLLLSAPAFLQFILTENGGGALIFQMHYATLFLPGIALAFMHGLRKAMKKFSNHQTVTLIIIMIAALYNFMILGPLWPSVQAMAREARNRISRDGNVLLAHIPNATSVGATYWPLTKMSSREHIYALHYLFAGKKQFSEDAYNIDAPPDYLIIDENDLRTFKVQYEIFRRSAESSQNGFIRLQQLITAGHYGILGRDGSLVVLRKDTSAAQGEYMLPNIPKNLKGYITLNGFRSGETVFLK